MEKEGFYRGGGGEAERYKSMGKKKSRMRRDAMRKRDIKIEENNHWRSSERGDKKGEAARRGWRSPLGLGDHRLFATFHKKSF